MYSGYSHSCAVDAIGGAAYCWGQSSLGQLGTGSPNYMGMSNVATKVQAPAGRWLVMEGGDSHTCGILVLS